MEHLDLFTPVEQGLPDDYSEKTILDINMAEGRAFYVKDVFWIGEREFYPSWVKEDTESGQCYLIKGWYSTTQEVGQNEYSPIDVTHWLDLSKLTTKEKVFQVVEAIQGSFLKKEKKEWIQEKFDL